MPADKKTIAHLKGTEASGRVPSRVLEECIQEAVKNGARELHITADGQHGIGGRIWPRESAVRFTVEGPVGQRLGSMGMEGTEILVKGSCSDDVGWVNCGAKITVLGDVTNGAHNAAAQGVLYVQGGAGARCDTLTKHNPRFDPPQSWYFRDVGDSFAEFKAGGISVVCGVNPRNPDNILGYRPCVGMVGGVIYFRGPIQGYSAADVKLLELTPEDWKWLKANMKPFLKAIEREDYYKELTSDTAVWRKFMAFTPAEKAGRRKMPVPMGAFSKEIWEKEVGAGGIFGEFLTHDRSLLPYITTGPDRRNKPVWANEKYSPPCAFNCPTHIPTHKRAALIRAGKLAEALELVLEYSPLPATVCGQICPNLCMQSCTRGIYLDRSLDVQRMGQLSLELKAPKPARKTGHKIAVIGGGPGGLSAAWHLALRGHEVDLYEAGDKLGGKLELCIPRERLPQEVLRTELERFAKVGVKVRLNSHVDRAKFGRIYGSHEAVVVACGAHKPRTLKFEGSGSSVSAYDFLRGINTGSPAKAKGREVVVIGAGNVGMDAALQAFNCGAKSVTAVDIQKPAAFGKELEAAKKKGVEILWPRSIERYDQKTKTLHFKDGKNPLKADILIVAVGETPIVDFLPESVHHKNGLIEVNEKGQTTDLKVYAIGDATLPGLVTNAIGQGRETARAIHAELMHYDYMPEVKNVIPYNRIKTAYYEMCAGDLSRDSGAQQNYTPEGDANRCLSCASCRDCRMCENVCYWGAISRVEKPDGGYEYAVDDDKCIGCGFCAGVCPCGVWEMTENLA
jgi:NADPH-dependent glutamate synthase beta subunit-like oxidoreductase/glutamate synthase domain-containing protein 3/NAD-dependent dihydropyrimidine dehydrogenase PreA subunit